MVRSGCAQCVEQLEQAIELYHGQFMSGFFLKDLIEFETWLEVKRQFYDQIAISALSDIAGHFLERDKYDIAQRAAFRQIEIDPYREIAHRQYMRSLIASGNEPRP